MFTRCLPFKSAGTRTFFPGLDRKYKKLVRVSSPDHDGCLGLQYMHPSDLVSMQAPFIQFLNQQKSIFSYDYDYLLTGSNRQSIPLDCINAIHNQNNLTFPVLNALAFLTGSYFDGFLLADITENRKPGFTLNLVKKFALIKNINLTEETASDMFLQELLKQNHADFTFSEDKINIIYAQMHRMALIHPVDMIHFHFYDDLCDQVLKKLINFYKKNRGLIPSNVIINFYYFNTLNQTSMLNEPSIPQLLYTIGGSGIIDANYYQTIRIMEQIAIREEGKGLKYHMSQYINQDILEEAFTEFGWHSSIVSHNLLQQYLKKNQP